MGAAARSGAGARADSVSELIVPPIVGCSDTSPARASTSLASTARTAARSAAGGGVRIGFGGGVRIGFGGGETLEMAISTGSACSSGRVEPSHVLIRMGVSEEDVRSSIRISLGRMNTEKEVRRATELLRTVVPRNRKHPRGTTIPERDVVDRSA